MDLIELTETPNNFKVIITERKIPKEQVLEVASLEIHYPKDSWDIQEGRIKKAARKQNISSRNYNSYEESPIPCDGAPEKARIRLFSIPRAIAKEEDKGNEYYPDHDIKRDSKYK